MPAIRAIFFDAVGTLIHPEPSAAKVYGEIGRRFGSRYSPTMIAARFSTAFRRQEEYDRQHAWVTSEQREYQRWIAIVGDVLDDVANPDRVFADLYEHFKKPASWRCEPGLEALAGELRENGIQVGLASNFDGRLHGLVQGLKPLRPFAAADNGEAPRVVISSEVGFRKPAPEFYQAMCRLVSLDAAQILYVGDDPINDYAGAKATGMQALLFDPHKRHADATRERIGKLEDVADYL